MEFVVSPPYLKPCRGAILLYIPNRASWLFLDVSLSFSFFFFFFFFFWHLIHTPMNQISEIRYIGYFSEKKWIIHICPQIHNFQYQNMHITGPAMMVGKGNKHPPPPPGNVYIYIYIHTHTHIYAHTHTYI